MIIQIRYDSKQTKIYGLLENTTTGYFWHNGKKKWIGLSYMLTMEWLIPFLPDFPLINIHSLVFDTTKFGYKAGDDYIIYPYDETSSRIGPPIQVTK